MSNTDDESKAERIFEQTYPSIHYHLKRFEEKLRKRNDRGSFWWELRACDYYGKIETQKIAVQVIAYHCRFTRDVDGKYVNDKVVFIPSGDEYLLGILNSRPAWWILNRICQRMNDDGLNIQPQYLSRLPIPITPSDIHSGIAETVCKLLARSDQGTYDLEAQLNRLVDEAFQLTDEERAVP